LRPAPVAARPLARRAHRVYRVRPLRPRRWGRTPSSSSRARALAGLQHAEHVAAQLRVVARATGKLVQGPLRMTLDCLAHARFAEDFHEAGLAGILADILADLAARAGPVEQIIARLKGLPE